MTSSTISPDFLAFANLHDAILQIEFGLERMIAGCDLIRDRLREGDNIDYFGGNNPGDQIWIELRRPVSFENQLRHEIRLAIELVRDQDIPGHWEGLKNAQDALYRLPEGLLSDLNDVAGGIRWQVHVRRLFNDLSLRHSYNSFLEVSDGSIGFPSSASDYVHICKHGGSIDGWRSLLAELRKRWQELKACRPTPNGQGVQEEQKNAAKGDIAVVGSLPNTTANDPLLTHVDLAKRYVLENEKARKRLDRWRAKHSDGWIEATDTRPNEPKYLYRLSAVQHLFDNASAETSG